MGKFSYLLRSLVNINQKKNCPFCGSELLKKVDKKYFLTCLLLCKVCGLKHRHPKDSSKFLHEFYQSEYKINNALMTSLPSLQEIEVLKLQNFSSLRDYNKYLRYFCEPNSKTNLLDYGCSWGYNVFKLKNDGYNVKGYELSIPRAKYGIENLNVEIYTDEKNIPDNWNIIFSSHVIEHLGDIMSFLKFSKKILTDDGLFISFCPNGSDAYAEREFDIFHVNWGEVHPNYLNVEFAKFIFQDNPYLILTGDWDFDSESIANWDRASQIVGSKLDGKELLIIAMPNRLINN